MLDVHRRDDIDPGREQLLDVLPALLVPAPRHIGVRQLVHQRHLRPACQQRVQVQLREPGPAVRQLAPRHQLETRHLCRRVPAPVILDERHHDVRATLQPPVRLREHGVRLADPGGRPEVDP